MCEINSFRQTSFQDKICGVARCNEQTSLSNKPLSQITTSRERVTRDCCTLGMACAQAVAMRGAPSAARRLIAAPRNQQPFRFDPHVFDRDF